MTCSLAGRCLAPHTGAESRRMSASRACPATIHWHGASSGGLAIRVGGAPAAALAHSTSPGPFFVPRRWRRRWNACPYRRMSERGQRSVAVGGVHSKRAERSYARTGRRAPRGKGRRVNVKPPGIHCRLSYPRRAANCLRLLGWFCSLVAALLAGRGR